MILINKKYKLILPVIALLFIFYLLFFHFDIKHLRFFWKDTSQLVKEKIDLSKKGKYEFSIVNNYSDSYYMQLMMYGFQNEILHTVVGGKYKTDLEIEINFYSKNKLIYSVNSMEYSTFLSEDSNGKYAGLYLNSYRVPENLPKDKPIEGELIIKNPDPNLAKYDNAYFLIQESGL